MTRRQLAVPVVAALLGGAVTAAAMMAGTGGTGTIARERGLLTLDTSSEQMTPGEIYDRSAPGVVAIRASTVQPGPTAFQAEAGSDLNISSGSGFVLDDDGRVVTNAHVVSGVTAVQVTFSDGHSVPAQVVGKDEETDIAVLVVPTDGLDLRPLEFGDSDAIRTGDRVVAIGNPTGFAATAGTGRISGSGRRVETPGGYMIDGLLETDAVIEPATSGGPLLGPDGRVVGITSRLGDDTGFAVPANLARDILAQLEESHKIIRPWLGVRGQAGSGGVEILGVHTGGPAELAGLHPGDVVTAIDGTPVSTLAGLLDQVDQRAVGDTIVLHVTRSGSAGDVTIRLEERPATVPAA
jgi:serine protease Do